MTALTPQLRMNCYEKYFAWSDEKGKKTTACGNSAERKEEKGVETGKSRIALRQPARFVSTMAEKE